MNIKCRGEDCPNKNSCKRYLCEENKPQCWFVHSPLYSDGTCHFFVQKAEECVEEIIQNTFKLTQVNMLLERFEEENFKPITG